MVSILCACPSTPALESVPEFQKNLNQVCWESGELTDHVEQLMDLGDLPSPATMLGTPGAALGPYWCSGHAALPHPHSR